jgi:hypothetical protein
MHFLLVVLTAVPVQIETLGFSVEVEGEVVTVSSVTPGSSAEKSGVVPGVVIDRVLQPTYLFARGKLGTLSPEDLHDALTPHHPEQLVFLGKLDGKTRPFSLPRLDPAPKDPPRILTADEYKRLSLMQQSLYTARLPSLTAPKPRPADPALSYGGRLKATVSPAGIHDIAATPEWIYLADSVQYHCPSTPMRSIELSGPAPVTKVIATSSDPHLRGSSVRVEIPMWRVKDAKAACARGEKQLASVALTATVRCEGAAPIVMPFQQTLALECVTEAPRHAYRWGGLRVKKETLVAGGDGATKVSVWWSALRPTPKKVALVEVDERDVVKKRLLTLSRGTEDTTEHELSIDVKKSRTVKLALELQFADGSIGVSTSQPVRIAEQATLDAEATAFRADGERFDAVMKQLRETFKEPCDDPKKAAEWLKKQPGVEFASVGEGGDISVSMGRIPVVIMCHHHR